MLWLPWSSVAHLSCYIHQGRLNPTHHLNAVVTFYKVLCSWTHFHIVTRETTPFWCSWWRKFNFAWPSQLYHFTTVTDFIMPECIHNALIVSMLLIFWMGEKPMHWQELYGILVICHILVLHAVAFKCVTCYHKKCYKLLMLHSIR